MLPSKYRLRSSQEISRVFNDGLTIKSFNLLAKYLPRNFSQPRFALSVSKKEVKKATQRNRLKRLLREAIKKHLEQFPPGDYLFVVYFRPERAGEKIKLEMVEKELKWMLIKLKEVKTKVAPAKK